MRGFWVRHVGLFVSMDLFCYTPNEFELLFEEYQLTAMDAIEQGIVLFGQKFITPYQLRYQKLIQ